MGTGVIVICDCIQVEENFGGLEPWVPAVIGLENLLAAKSPAESFVSEQTYETIDGSAYQKIRHDRQDERNDEGLSGIDPVHDFERIDDVQDDCQDKNLPNPFPAQF